MNQKKKIQEKIKFSKLRLHSSSNKSGKSCSPRPQEKISSYFSSVLNESEINSNFENTSKDVSQSMITRLRNKMCVPNISTKICAESNTDSDTPDDISDFTKPKISKEVKKLRNKSSNHESSTKSINRRKTQSIRNSRPDQFKNDTNQEHLQLAIAMSKSIVDVENPQDAESVENTYPSTQQKIMRVKQTLDEFGFKYEKCPTQNSKKNVKLMKGKKFKYFTPTLFLRTEADRTKLIENKVSQIINNISIYNNALQEKNMLITSNVDNKPRSFILRDYYEEEPVLFNKNALCVSDKQKNIFYNSIIQPSNVAVGVLLKDWLSIPGREATPPLEKNISPKITQDESVNVLQASSTELSMSPELFTDSDGDHEIEHNKKINTSRKGFGNSNSTNSIIQIDKEDIVESYSSTKSVSLLDNIKANNNKNISIANMSETIDLSLSPFPDTTKFLSTATIKQIKSKHDLEDKNNENSDSLSPFEPVNLEINKSPQRKVTPKKKSPSPKKYVITPKGRKIISPNNRKKYSPCKRSILFTEKPDVETIHNESNKNNEICHFESFCNDSIECFDLTHSSDDEAINQEKINKNDNITDKSFTITQLLNELSPAKCTSNKEQIFHDSQASIETIKLNISKSIDSDLDEEYSPEFDCLNISNNKVFYETFNNSISSQKDGSMITSEKLCNSLTRNEVQNQIDLSNSNVREGENCDSEIHDNRETYSTPVSVRNSEENVLKTPLITDKIDYSCLSQNEESPNKKIINDNEIQEASTPLNKYFGLSTTDRKLSQSVNELETNLSIKESNDNIVLSRSSISTCSDISDEELNYSCNSIYKRYNLSNKVISISDEENDNMTSATVNEDILKSTTHLHESLNISKKSAIEDNLRSINKTLQHPRVSQLNTPSNVMKTANLNHDYLNEEKSLVKKNVIQETITSNNIATPKTDIIINDNITPKGHYSDMDTPERNRELEKYGLKPMKRNKGVKILHYIYDSTHPYVNDSNDEKISNNSSDDENDQATKRRKTKSNEVYNEEISSIAIIQNENKFVHDNIREDTNQIAESENIEDMIFERKLSTKISSCRLPLHVAWNNLVIHSKELQETILTYTPIQVEEIYEQLKKLGYKYHIQDIIAFLDKKCITIRIAQNNRLQKKGNSIK